MYGTPPNILTRAFLVIRRPSVSTIFKVGVKSPASRCNKVFQCPPLRPYCCCTPPKLFKTKEDDEGKYPLEVSNLHFITLIRKGTSQSSFHSYTVFRHIARVNDVSAVSPFEHSQCPWVIYFFRKSNLFSVGLCVQCNYVWFRLGRESEKHECG